MVGDACCKRPNHKFQRMPDGAAEFTTLGSLMARKSLSLVSILMFPSLGAAHGEEILVTIGAQLAVVIAIVIALFAVRRFQPYLMGGILTCVAGVVLSWVITANMPYFENKILIAAIDVCSPLVANAAFLSWRCRRALQK